MQSDVTTDMTAVSRRKAFRFDAETMTRVHWAAAALAAVTGTVHVYLYVTQGFLPFLFAGVVFYAAIIGMSLNVYRRVLYALGVPFTAGQVALWVYLGMPDATLGALDKVVQLALIALLVYLFRAEA